MQLSASSSAAAPAIVPPPAITVSSNTASRIPPARLAPEIPGLLELLASMRARGTAVNPDAQFSLGILQSTMPIESSILHWYVKLFPNDLDILQAIIAREETPDYLLHFLQDHSPHAAIRQAAYQAILARSRNPQSHH